MNELTQARVRELLSYNRRTGVLRWKVRRGGKATQGVAADSGNSHGYIRVGIDGVRYQAHRVIWLYVYGSWPQGAIDHINGVRHDNRLTNLRVVTTQQNCWNQRRPQQTNPYLGVYRVRNGRFMALITAAKVRYYLGRFDTAEGAREAYLAAKAKLHNINDRFTQNAALLGSKIPHVEV